MFTVKLNEQGGVDIVDAGRGQWKCVYDGAVQVFEGFGGENTVTIQLIPWQSGHTMVGITVGRVDDWINSYAGRHTRGDDVAAVINNYLLKELGQ